jgi:hypothetical protein
MSMFAKQLRRGVSSFGKQLGRGIQTFGRQVGRGAQAVERGLERGANVIDSIEKVTDRIPIVRGAVRASEAVLRAGSAGSGAVSSGLKGRPFEAFRKGQFAVQQGQEALSEGGQALAKASMFL